jgi:hypothetical protein
LNDELCKKPGAVTVFAKFAMINAALLLHHFLFYSAQKIAGCLIQQYGFTFLAFDCGNFHVSVVGENDFKFNC